MLGQWFAETLASTVVATALVGVLIYLFQNMLIERLKVAVKAEYDAKLESHKAQLAAANSKELEILKAQLKGHADSELEQFKSSLQVQATQQNLTFSKLHERRVEAISQIHEYLIRVLRDVHAYIAAFEVSGGPTREDRLKTLSKSYDELGDYFVRGQLFLPRTLANKVAHLESEYRRITNQYTLVVHADPTRPDHMLWVKLNQDLAGAIKTALEETQEEMRIALGDPPQR